MSNFLLRTPKHKIAANPFQSIEPEEQHATRRKSSRDSTKNSKGRSILKLTQDLVEKMWDYPRRQGAR
jgi:hypothetical protein